MILSGESGAVRNSICGISSSLLKGLLSRPSGKALRTNYSEQEKLNRKIFEGKGTDTGFDLNQSLV